MKKQLIARGQVTITTQTDVYTITQSVNDYVFPAANNGTIVNAASFISTVKVTQNNINVTDFTIGSISQPVGFASISINNTNKSITYKVAANTTNLADQGILLIPIIIKGQTYYINTAWSKAKQGSAGSAGKDAYTISTSRNNFIISTDKQGTIHTSVTTSTVISALKGQTAITPVIGTLPTVAGCSLSKSGTTVTIVFIIGSALAENGNIDIPITVDGKTFYVSFAYAKARTGVDGATGAAGKDSNLLDWVKDWNTNKTVIGSDSVITPKIYAGVKNSNGTLTGIAIGKFPLSVVQASGSIATETVNGIYGFKDGYKTFLIDNAGNAQLGRGNQFIKYNSSTGKVEFGSEVSLNWTSAANNALSSAKTYADTKKTEAISAAANDATSKVNSITIGGRNYALRTSNEWSNPATLTNILNQCVFSTTILAADWKENDIINVSFDYKYEDFVKASSNILVFQGSGNKTGWSNSFTGYSLFSKIDFTAKSGEIHINYSFKLSALQATNDSFGVMIRHDYITGKAYIKNLKVEKGSKTTDWTPAPEDINSNINKVKQEAETDATNKSNKAKSDAISAAASDATSKVNNIVIGGRNFLKGTSSGKNWTAGHFKENNTFQVTAAKTGETFLYSPFVSFEAGETYTLSFDTKEDASIKSRDMFFLSNNYTTNKAIISKGFPKSANWHKVVWTFIAPDTFENITDIRFRMDHNGSANAESASIWVKNIKLEKGNKATDWTPAPEDVDSTINQVKQEAANDATTKSNKAKSDAISAAANDAQNKVNAIQIGARNYIKTSIFTTTNVSGVITVDGVNAILDSAEKYLGYNSLKITQTAATGTNANTGRAYFTATKLCNPASFSMWIKASAATTLRIRIGGGTSIDIAISTAWKLIKLENRIPNSTVVLFGVTTAGITYNIAHPMLVEGTKCTDWSPSVEDLNADATNKSTQAKNDAISAAAKDATDKMNSIVIGGRNLLNNTSDWKAAGWNGGITSNGGGYTVDNTVLYDGKPTLKTLVGAGLNHNWIKLENDVEYTYSAMVRCNENIAGNSSVPLHYHAGLNNVNQSKISIIKFDTTVVAGQWKKIYITFKLTGDANSFRPFLYRGSNGTTTYWVAYIRLEKGNKATDWTPSVSDTTAIIADAKKAGNDAKTVADAITKKAADEKWETKLTYIDGTGIFTGKLSANTVTAININGSQITAGTINAARIDVASLKASLITAGNIEALTLNVVRGRVGGWSIDGDSIYRGTKNNGGVFTAGSGSMTIGSNGIRGFKWNFDSTGAGSVAGGNIKWDAAGNVIFGASVVLNWTNAATNAANGALTSAKTYADTKKTEAINAAATDATNKSNAAKDLAQAMAFGRMIYRDPTFFNGNNGINVYNNSANGTVTITRITDSNAPNDSKQTLLIKNTGTSSPNCGGFYFANGTSYRKIFICRIIAKIPSGRNIGWFSNTIGTGGTQKWLTPTAGTGDWCEYITKVTCGTANFSNTNFFAITGATGTSTAPVEWRLAYATVFDVTSTEKYTTTIDANGIYTSTLNANQITAGTIHADRIAAGSIHAAKLDASSIKASIINADYLNGLTLNFVRGKIGGWIIGTDNIQIGSLNVVGQTPLQLRSVSSGSGYVYSGQFKPLGLTLSWFQGSNAGHLIFGQVMSTGNSIKSGFLGIQMMAWDGTEYFTVSANSTKVGSKEVYNRIAGWAFDNDTIYRGSKKNETGTYTNVSGSISIGSSGLRGFKWRLDSTGAGAIAGGNISWDANGNVIFGSSVSLQWKNDIELSKRDNFGYAYYKKIIVKGEENKYYPVIIKGGIQDYKRDILVRRDYSEQAPESWHTSTHKGGLILLIKTNFGGWGGSTYSWDIYELAETFCNTFSGAEHLGNYTHFAIYLRGGGTNGAVYHLYSDLPLDGQAYSPVPNPEAPQICYNQEVYWQNGSSQLKAPAPRTRSAADLEEIRRRRFITLTQERDSYLTSHPLTYIGSTGIYTGTLTANQINAVAIDAGSIKAGTISVDRIAAGSITATKINVADVQASVVTATAVNGLTCAFTKGTIGGWNIGRDTISIGAVGGGGQTPIQIRPTSSGSGFWYNGTYKPMGMTITWNQSKNAGHIVFGQVAVSGSLERKGFIGIQMMGHDDTEYFCLSTNYTKAGEREVYNRIAGWSFDDSRIWKNSVSLGADGSIQNGSKWQINADGSGKLANGNISWNVFGTVTFSSAVAHNWETDATNKANGAKELAMAMSFGKMLYRYPEFYHTTTSYNSTGTFCSNTTRAIIGYSGCPNSTGYVMRCTATNWASSTDYRIGGFYWATNSRANAVFIVRIVALIPAGRFIMNYNDSFGTGGVFKWLTSNIGTGKWEEYICKVTCGSSGSFGAINNFALTGGTAPTASAPVNWYIAYATVYDMYASEKYNTTIDVNGIYTGSIRAYQVKIDSALVVGGSSYNGSISVRDASNIVKVTLNRSGITAVGGSIGGWVIESNQISKNGIALGADGSITNGSKWGLYTDGSGILANGNIKWDASGNLSMRGKIDADSGTIGGFEISRGHIGSVASGAGSGGGLAIYDSLFRVGSNSSFALLGDDTFPASAGGAFKSTARFTNTKSDNNATNIGLYLDVRYAKKNYGIHSNAALFAPYMITNKIKVIGFGSGTYSIDFAQNNLFFVFATTNSNVILPTEASVREMFSLSSLPSDFACIFTFVYNYNWNNRITISNVYNSNGALTSVAMEKGDSITFICSKYPSFHYQIMHHTY